MMTAANVLGLLSLQLKEFWKSVNTWRSHRQKYSGLDCLTHKVYMSKLHFCACCMWLWHGTSLVTLQYVMYFRFRGWRHLCT